MQSPTEEALYYSLMDLTAAPATSLALVGNPRVGKAMLCGLAEKSGHTCAVVDVPSMPSKEDVWEYRRKEAVVEGGRAELPSFFHAFLQLCGINEIPQILLLHRFNYVPSASTYHLKAMVEPFGRRNDPYLDGLKCVVLTIGRPGTADVFEIDKAVNHSLAKVILVDPSSEST